MTRENTNTCKGLAITMMYIHHLFYSAKTFEGFDVSFAPVGEENILLLARICKLCVAIFVLLTGYGYAKVDKAAGFQTSTEKTVKRYFRIMFGYWFVFVLAQLTAFLGARSRLVLYGETTGERVINIIIDSLGLAKLFGTPTFNATWWYISYAVLLIFLTPFIIKAVRKGGLSVLIIVAFLPRVLGDISPDSNFFRYFLTLVMGIYLAENDVFEKIKKYFEKKAALEFVMWAILFGFSLYLWRETGWYGILDSCVASLIIYFCMRYISKIPFLKSILEFIGKHSMNMFMTHTFVYSYYFKEFTYSFKNWFLILVVLLITTFVLSLIIEWIKKTIRYDRLESICIEKTVGFINSIENRG